MASFQWTRLPERGVVAVRGDEAGRFLQNLITNDVDDLAAGVAGYGALLTPQGKVQFDFILHKSTDGFLFDIVRGIAADLAKRLTFYRLRTPVEIADRSEELSVVAVWGDVPVIADPLVLAPDPRLPALGMRAIVAGDAALLDGIEADPAAYHRHRIALGIPEGGTDFAHGEVFPHDADIDQIGGIDFAKGCYVGQEVVSRMEHRSRARRRIVHVRSDEALPPDTELRAGDLPLGTIGSVDGKAGLALVRVDRVARALRDGTPILAGHQPVTLTLPEWARFGWPDEETADPS